MKKYEIYNWKFTNSSMYSDLYLSCCIEFAPHICVYNNCYSTLIYNYKDELNLNVNDMLVLKWDAVLSFKSIDLIIANVYKNRYYEAYILGDELRL